MVVLVLLLLLPTSSASHVNSKFDCITVKHQGRNSERGEKKLPVCLIHMSCIPSALDDKY